MMLPVGWIEFDTTNNKANVICGVSLSIYHFNIYMFGDTQFWFW